MKERGTIRNGETRKGCLKRGLAWFLTLACVSGMMPGVPGVKAPISAQAAETTEPTEPSAEGSGNTDFVAGVVIDDGDMRLKVTVPMVFAFVVNGTVDSAHAQEAVTVENGGLLLPNVKVVVDTPSTDGANGTYHLEVGETGNWMFTNYSTKNRARDGSEDAYVDPATGRVGTTVDVWGAVETAGSAASRNYWNHVAEIEAGDAGFKQYTLSVTSRSIVQDTDSVAKETVAFTTERDGNFAMGKVIRLSAPDATAGVDSVTKLALVGSEEDVTFGVAVGGKRGNYTQVEQSAKVGTVIWTIQTPKFTAANTAPNNPFLDAPSE